MRGALPLLLIGCGAALAGGRPAPDEPAPPSIELLEYLAEYVEDDTGRLVDPLETVARGDTPADGESGPREPPDWRTPR